MSLWAKISIWLAEKIQNLANMADPSPTSLYPPFDAKIDALLLAAHEKGLNVGLFQGYRSFEEQAILYSKGRSRPGKIITNAKPGQSLHNYGIAADIVFRVNGEWSWVLKHPWEKLGKLGKELGLKWGGDFKRLKDFPHFEWKTDLTLIEMKKFYQEGGLPSVWKNL